MAQKQTAPKKLVEEKQKQNEPLFAIHRYFIWANFMRTMFDKFLTNNRAFKQMHDEAFIFMSYWYGGLYVVIEGWQQLKLSDSTVDNLLQETKYVNLLKLYRNGVFHYQPKYFDPRFSKLINEKGIVLWVRKLNRAFGAYFLNMYPRKVIQERECLHNASLDR